ncbi:unnamed protein product [Polarella glacialis]|uniref:AB hydrolase-1 domain-containing protein n=1 Tax=Polarella glacialis TaxID=89957 RepID=A0A813EV59_POLGL|nr:unnamed protein product [Polarella glacialis]CAE8679860.1 unnamed protein product [Polarella glacialis]
MTRIKMPALLAEPLAIESPTQPMDTVFESLLHSVEMAAELGYPTEQWLSGWFLGADVVQIRRGNLAELIAFLLYSKNPATLDGPTLRRIDIMVEEACARLGFSLASGYEPEVRCMRFLHDPVLIVHRSLAQYLVACMLPRLVTWVLFRLVFGLRRAECTETGLYYWWRAPPINVGADVPRDLLFFHGLCGFIGYVPLLSMLLFQNTRGAALIEDESVSMCLNFERQPTRATVVRTAVIAMARIRQERARSSRGWDASRDRGCVLLGHSLGTCAMQWILEEAPSMCGAAVFIDPIVLLLEMPNTTYGFLYRAPRTVFQWFCYLWCTGEPGIAFYFRRRFWWYNNRLTAESVTDLPTLFCLSEHDDLSAVPTIHAYIKRELQHSDILWWPGGGHTHFMGSLGKNRQIARWIEVHDQCASPSSRNCKTH